MGKVFKLLFGVCEKERLIKASQCCLSTTAGPIAGLLFISTKKVAFCSERLIKVSCPNGETIQILYKVIPWSVTLGLSLSLICSFSPTLIRVQISDIWVVLGFQIGCNPANKDREGQPEWKYQETITKICTDSHYWWFWFLVHGIHEIWKIIQLPPAGDFSRIRWLEVFFLLYRVTDDVKQDGESYCEL